MSILKKDILFLLCLFVFGIEDILASKNEQGNVHLSLTEFFSRNGTKWYYFSLNCLTEFTFDIIKASLFFERWFWFLCQKQI